MVTFREPALPPIDTHRASANAARLGLFWALPTPGGDWDIVAVSHPFAEVPEIGGFRTLESGHVDLWARIKQAAGVDVVGEYEDYPRGRVNWREEDQRFLLLLDPVLSRPTWVARVMAHFALPEATTLILTDPHYRSTRRPPAESPHMSAGTR